MAQDLGRIEPPSAAQFAGKRKLFLVPLVYEPPADAEEGQAILARYWEQAQSQLAGLEVRLGAVRHVYHEAVAIGGEEGLKRLQELNTPSARLVSWKCLGSGTLEATDDEDAFLEVMDLQRLLSIPIANPKVTQRLQEWFTESTRSRYEHIAQRIDETLGEDQAGLLIISEQHQVQFPSDIEVFYVSPPALDELRRWLQTYMIELQGGFEAQAMTLETDEGKSETPEG
jgi:hypothetical protein